MDLSRDQCLPCQKIGRALTSQEIELLLKEVPSWHYEQSLKKTFKFKNFNEALQFVNQVGALAEKEGHHPDITLQYNKVTLSLMTHALKGLSRNDFILAAKIDFLI